MEQKKEVSFRFIEAFNALLEKGLVSDKRDFASKLGISASMITEISKGRSSVGTSAIQNIVAFFNIDANWLLIGQGEMFMDEAHTSGFIKDDTENNPFQPIITQLLDNIKEQAEEIGQLRERITQLEREKGKGVSDARTSGVANAG